MWKSLWLLGDNDWIVDAIQEGTCVAVTYRSYIREMYPDLCSCAFILECSKGRGAEYLVPSLSNHRRWCVRIEGSCLVSYGDTSYSAVIAVNKFHPGMTGHVNIYSDCLGALKKIISLPADRLPSVFKHSDILKTS